MARRQAPGDRWAQYMDSEGAMHVEANGFINLQLSWDGAEKKRVVSPPHYVVMWSSREKSGKMRYTSSLLSLRLVEEADLPEQVEVAIEVRGRDGETTSCGGQYIEFELLAQPSDVPKQTPLAIVAGPVRVNAETELREFMRIDMGRCLREILSDVIDDPIGKQRGQLSRRRWYICVEVMRLICGANSLDCSALDTADVPPLEWVLCLSDERVAQAVCPEMAHLQDKSIDELTKFIDGGSKKGKAKKKKKEEERCTEPPQPIFPEGTRWQLPLGWMDQAEDLGKHLRCWQELGRCELTKVIEGNRYLRLRLRPDGARLVSTPDSCVLAFPRHDAVKRMSETEMLGATNVPFFSTLLNIFLFSNDELRDPGKEFRCPPTEVSKGNLVFELMVRQRDCPTPPPLRFSSGPCSPTSRVDMSRTVQWTEPELVQLRVDGREEPVIRMRWWINIEVLQMVCKSNSIDCSGLERVDVEPFEWLCCVYDDGFPGAPALQERNWAFRDETRASDGYPSAVPKAVEEVKRGRKKREKQDGPSDPEHVKATAVALFDLMSSFTEDRGRAAASAAAAAAAAASGDPVAQVKAAAELLAQAAAQSNSPRKYAAALEAAQLAAEPPQPSSSSRARFPNVPKAQAQRGKEAAKLGASRVDASETEESLTPDESLSASKALAASLSSRRPESTGASASASFRDGLLRVSGIDAAGLDLQGLLLSGLREGLAQVPSMPKEPGSTGASASNVEPRRRKRR